MTVVACPGGNRNRNARLARLRQLLPFDHAIVGIDLADPGGAECHVPPRRRGSSGSSVPGNGEPDMALSATPGRSPPRVQFPVIRCLDLAPRVIGGPQANL